MGGNSQSWSLFLCIATDPDRLPSRSNFIAMMSIAGGIGGVWFISRLLASRRRTVTTTNEGMEGSRTADSLQTNVANRMVVTPRKR
jgi:hypothetical protein